MKDRKRLEQFHHATRLYNAGQHDEAVTEFESIRSAFGDDELQSEEFAHYCGNYGSALAESGNLKRAESMFKAALLAYGALGLTTDVARTHFNLGNVYGYMNSRQRQSNSFLAALSAYREAGDDEGEAQILLSLAASMLNAGVPDLAEERLAELAGLMQTVESHPLLQWSFRYTRARLAIARADPDSALRLLQEALACLDNVSDVSYQRETYNAIMQVRAMLGQLPTVREIDEAVAASAASGRRRLAETLALAKISREIGDHTRGNELYERCLTLVDQTRSQLDGTERLNFMDTTVQIAQEYSADLVADGRAEHGLEVSERGQGRTLLDLMFRHQIKRQGGRTIRVGANGRVWLDTPGIDNVRGYCGERNLHILKILVADERSTAWFVDPEGNITGWNTSATMRPLDRLVELLDWTPPDTVDGHGGSSASTRSIGPGTLPPWEEIETALAELYEALLPADLRRRLEGSSGRLLIVPHRHYFHLPWSAVGPRGAPLGERWDIGVAPSIGIALQLDRQRDVEPWRGLDSFQLPAAAFGGIPGLTVEIPMLPTVGAPLMTARFIDLPWTLAETGKVAELTGGISWPGMRPRPTPCGSCSALPAWCISRATGTGIRLVTTHLSCWRRARRRAAPCWPLRTW